MSEGPELDVNVERGAAATLLRNPSFRNLVFASATSSIGDWIGLFALIGLAANLGGPTRVGALAVSFVLIARIVPTLFFAPLAGVFVDRWDRKRTMIATDVVRGVVMLGIAFVGDVFGLVIATFVIEVAAALFIPAKDATVPTIVDKKRLVQANQLSMLSTYATLPIGALLAAVVIGITERLAEWERLVVRFPDAMAFLAERPEAVPIILNALTFFGSIWFVSKMHVPDDHVAAYEQRADRTSAWAELRDGLEFITGMPLIRALVGGIMTAFLAAGVVMGVGEFFATILNAGDSGFATLGFMVGLGLVLGIIGAGPLADRIAKERLFAPGVGVAGGALVVAAFMPTLWLAAIPALVMGLGAGVAFILGYTMLQEYSHDEVRGRTFAAFNTAVRMALFAALVIGPLAIVVLGVERTNAQIRQGEDAIEDIEQFDEEGRYPYQLGGVRWTLISSGILAVGGAVWTGASIASVLRRREEDGEDELGFDLYDTIADETRAEATAGVLIVFEGGEGAGKSTQVQQLRETLDEAGADVLVTREPGGTAVGESVRELLLDRDGEVGPRTEALLYAAARAQHVADVIRPALAAGTVVICDRYIDSSIAYQGEGRDLGTGIIADLNRWATDDLTPDLTILLDIPASVGLMRARDVDEPDRLEAESAEFHERVNATYRRWATREPNRYLVLDAREPADELHAAILHRLQRVLPAAVVRGFAAMMEPPPEPEVPEPDDPATPPDARSTQPVTEEEIAALTAQEAARDLGVDGRRWSGGDDEQSPAPDVAEASAVAEPPPEEAPAVQEPPAAEEPPVEEPVAATRRGRSGARWRGRRTDEDDEPATTERDEDRELSESPPLFDGLTFETQAPEREPAAAVERSGPRDRDARDDDEDGGGVPAWLTLPSEEPSARE